MALVLGALVEILRKPTIAGIAGDLVLFCAPLWIAVFVGLLVGWVWKPRWATFSDFSAPHPPAVGTLPEPAPPNASALASLGVNLTASFNSLKAQCPQSLIAWVSEDRAERKSFEPAAENSDCSMSGVEDEKQMLVGKEDLEHLCLLVEVKDGGPAWIPMMDRSTKKMTYQAWRRDPQVGPPQYRSRTVFEDAAPELVRDFFWDDEFRAKWDDMLIHSETLEECPTTGTMLVHWIRKFPFFCSDREYTIGRRIWELGGTYYCVTKGVPCSSVPRHNKPRRVDLYYSSWCIRAVESRNRDGQLKACEVLLFHHEDMGIPWEIAKFGVRQGMWGAVKKIEPGLRAYQEARRSGAPLSRCAFMAQINTKVGANYLQSLGATDDSLEIETSNSKDRPLGKFIPKFLVIGGAVALACSIDRGLLTKAVIFGIARRFAKVGRRL